MFPDWLVLFLGMLRCLIWSDPQQLYLYRGGSSLAESWAEVVLLGAMPPFVTGVLRGARVSAGVGALGVSEEDVRAGLPIPVDLLFGETVFRKPWFRFCCLS